ncbi:MAG4530 family protein [Mycoplasma hafezii]|uniref:MAG4530 family protein n=1 Tax=Mycoplasma hafezii TaxID=525886 RepID=UPI003CEFE54F
MDTIKKDKAEFVQKKIKEIAYYESTVKKILIIILFGIIFLIAGTNLIIFTIGFFIPNNFFLNRGSSPISTWKIFLFWFGTLLIWLFSIYLIVKSILVLIFKKKDCKSLRALRAYYLLNFQFAKFKSTRLYFFNLDSFDRKMLKHFSKENYAVYGSAVPDIFWNKNFRKINDIDLFQFSTFKADNKIEKNLDNIEFNDGLFLSGYLGKTKIGISNTSWVPKKFITKHKGIYTVKPEIALLDKYAQLIKYLNFNISDEKSVNIIRDINFMLEQNNKKISNLLNDKLKIEEIYSTKLICNLFTTYFVSQHEFKNWEQILNKDNINRKIQKIIAKNNLILNSKFNNILNHIIESKLILRTYQNTYEFLKNKQKVTELFYECNTNNQFSILDIKQTFDSINSVNKLKSKLNLETCDENVKQILNAFNPVETKVDIRYLILITYLEVNNVK